MGRGIGSRAGHRSPVVRRGRSLRSADLLRAALATVMLVSLPMCARPGRPPGGPRDLLPPQVVETSPAGQTQLEDMGGDVVITFNERISERVSNGTLEQAVVVSPEVPGLEVKHGSDGITLRAPGGWKEQQVYRVRVLPVIQDLFQNRMVGPFEFVFGTGMGFSRGAIAGVVNDRLTGLPVTGVRVTASQAGAGRADVPLFVSLTDSLGIFAMRWMVQGRYDLAAFTDVNRNREADPFEQIGVGSAEFSREDTTIVNLAILRPDTTPAVVGRVDIADPSTLEVTLDDFVAQEDSLSGVTVVLTSGSRTVPAISGVVHHGVYQDTLAARKVVADSLEAVARAADAAEVAATAAAAAIAGGDSVGGAGAEAVVPPDPIVQGADRADPDGDGEAVEPPPALLPRQEFYVLLADTLEFDVEYVVRIGGIININGLGAGEGVDTIVRVAPPPPIDSTTADTTQPPPDTTGGRGR